MYFFLHRGKKAIATSLLLLILSIPCLAAKKTAEGIVIDSDTGEGIPFTNIFTVNEKSGLTSDINGHFIFQANDADSVRFSASGFTPRTLAMSDLKRKDNNILLSAFTNNLSEIIVKPKRQKYSKKNNPAYDLMVKIRDTKKITDPRQMPHYSFDTYERISLALNDFVIPDDFASRKIGFVADYADTAARTGVPILLVSVREKTATSLFSRRPDRAKTITTGIKAEGIDKAFNQDNIDKMLSDVLRETDIFSNDITLIQNRFVSPLSHIAGDYYMFFITDSLTADGRKYKELSFAPKTPESFGFNGRMLVADLDSTTFIKSVDMRVPLHINLNYIRNIFIHQDFELDSLGKRRKVLDDMSVEIQLMPGTQSFYARRISAHNNFRYSQHPSLSGYMERLGHDFVLDEAPSRPNAFWNRMRLIPLSVAESKMGTMLGRLRQIPWFFWTEKILSVLVQGYFSPVDHSKFDFGPVNTLISYNKAEGVRFRLGGMTTAELSRHWLGRGYVAYGLRDHKVKYELEAEYSFTPKKYHSREFPIKSVKLYHQYDVDMLGQHYLFTNPDNIFLSIKRKESYLATYRRLSLLEYQLELNNNFSLKAGLRHEIQEASPFVRFERADGTFAKRFSQAAIYVQLRYAPGEKFSQGRRYRLPINMDAPIFCLTHEYGPRGFLGAQFTLNRTEISAQKRFWFSAFGYTDIILKGGKIWSTVQYPALMWPNANLSYTIQPESYSLMNPMEFANDWYASLDLTYWVNGAILNRIPLIKKLKLREVFTFKMLFGGLDKKNNPEFNENLFLFPADASARIMNSRKPYMEIGCGIDNILTIARIDYVWRLSYRDLPGVDRSGLRVSLHFSF
ncbi:MAG: DUF5686 and carboxypeptidase regulatory-like domain-containing protein [Muribaculum sp.]|nr:DUF5686 and carboxypeptidase regulatory-like domain-containing protein [Muribaculum sp.]